MEGSVDNLGPTDAEDAKSSVVNGCENCQRLSEDLDKVHSDHALNYTQLKDKIISTDKLIKRYKTKCQEHDLQVKKAEDACRRTEQYKRDCETLEFQLKTALEEATPLKQNLQQLERVSAKNEQTIAQLRDSLKAAQVIAQQYEAAQAQVEAERAKIQETCHTQSLTIRDLEARVKKSETTVKKLEGEGIARRSELTDARRNIKCLQQSKKKQQTRLSAYNAILEKHGLLTEANRHARELRIKPEVKLQPVTSGDEEDIAMETMDPGEGTSAGPPVKERTKEESQEQSDVDRLFEQIFAELSPHGSNEERGFIEELWSPLSPALSGLSSDENDAGDEAGSDDDIFAETASELESQLLASPKKKSPGKSQRSASASSADTRPRRRSRRACMVASTLTTGGVLEVQESLSDTEIDAAEENEIPFKEFMPNSPGISNLTKDLDLSSSESDSDNSVKDKGNGSTDKRVTRSKKKSQSILPPQTQTVKPASDDKVFKAPLPVSPLRMRTRRVRNANASPVRPLTRSMSCPTGSQKKEQKVKVPVKAASLDAPPTATIDDTSTKESAISKPCTRQQRRRNSQSGTSSESEGDEGPDKGDKSKSIVAGIRQKTRKGLQRSASSGALSSEGNTEASKGESTADKSASTPGSTRPKRRSSLRLSHSDTDLLKQDKSEENPDVIFDIQPEHKISRLTDTQSENIELKTELDVKKSPESARRSPRSKVLTLSSSESESEEGAQKMGKCSSKKKTGKTADSHSVGNGDSDIKQDTIKTDDNRNNNHQCQKENSDTITYNHDTIKSDGSHEPSLKKTLSKRNQGCRDALADIISSCISKKGRKSGSNTKTDHSSKKTDDSVDRQSDAVREGKNVSDVNSVSKSSDETNDIDGVNKQQKDSLDTIVGSDNISADPSSSNNCSTDNTSSTSHGSLSKDSISDTQLASQSVGRGEKALKRQQTIEGMTGLKRQMSIDETEPTDEFSDYGVKKAKSGVEIEDESEAREDAAENRDQEEMESRSQPEETVGDNELPSEATLPTNDSLPSLNAQNDQQSKEGDVSPDNHQSKDGDISPDTADHHTANTQGTSHTCDNAQPPSVINPPDVSVPTASSPVRPDSLPLRLPGAFKVYVKPGSMLKKKDESVNTNAQSSGTESKPSAHSSDSDAQQGSVSENIHNNIEEPHAEPRNEDDCLEVDLHEGHPPSNHPHSEEVVVDLGEGEPSAGQPDTPTSEDPCLAGPSQSCSSTPQSSNSSPIMSDTQSVLSSLPPSPMAGEGRTTPLSPLSPEAPLSEVMSPLSPDPPEAMSPMSLMADEYVDPISPLPPTPERPRMCRTPTPVLRSLTPVNRLPAGVTTPPATVSSPVTPTNGRPPAIVPPHPDPTSRSSTRSSTQTRTSSTSKRSSTAVVNSASNVSDTKLSAEDSSTLNDTTAPHDDNLPSGSTMGHNRQRIAHKSQGGPTPSAQVIRNIQAKLEAHAHEPLPPRPRRATRRSISSEPKSLPQKRKRGPASWSAATQAIPPTGGRKLLPNVTSPKSDQADKVSPPKKPRASDNKALDRELHSLLKFRTVGVETVAQKIFTLNCNTEHLVNAVIKLLLSNECDLLMALYTSCTKLKDISSWTPVLADHESRVVRLLLLLQGQQADLCDHFLSTIIARVLKKEGGSVLGKQSLCRVAAGVCRQKGHVECVRVFLYTLVYHQVVGYSSFLAGVAGVWPEVLHKRKNGSHDAVLKVIEFIVMKSLPQKLSVCMKKLLCWDGGDLDTTEIATHLLDRLGEVTADIKHLNQELTFSLQKALELLAVCSQWSWVRDSLLSELLLPRLKTWVLERHDDSVSNVMVTYVLCLLGAISCQCPAPRREDIKTVLDAVIGLLEGNAQQSVPVDTQIIALESILRLTPYNPQQVATATNNWVNHHSQQVLSRPDLKQKLMDFSDLYECRTEDLNLNVIKL